MQFYLIDGATNTHTHVHPKRTVPVRSLLEASSSRKGELEVRAYSRTSPPHAVFNDPVWQDSKGRDTQERHERTVWERDTNEPSGRETRTNRLGERRSDARERHERTVWERAEWTHERDTKKPSGRETNRHTRETRTNRLGERHKRTFWERDTNDPSGRETQTNFLGER